jgi:hypothetical protein
MAYRIYLTDSFYLQGQNKIWTARFEDILNGNVKVPEEMDGDAIAESVISGAGLVSKE